MGKCSAVSGQRLLSPSRNPRRARRPRERMRRPRQRMRRPREEGAVAPGKGWETPRPKRRAWGPREGAWRGEDALQTNAPSSAGTRRLEERRCAAGVRPGPHSVRRARRSASDCSGLAVSPAVEGRAPRSASPAAPASRYLSRRSSRARGGSCVPPGSTEGWPDGTSAEGRTQGARGQRGGRAPAPEQVPGSAGQRGLRGCRAERWEWPGRRGGALSWAWPSCGCDLLGRVLNNPAPRRGPGASLAGSQ